MTHKLIGMIKIPINFSKAYNNDIYNWLALVDQEELLINKLENNIHFRAETDLEPIDFLCGSTLLSSGNEAYSRIVSILVSQDIELDVYIIDYDTKFHRASQISVELRPNPICNEINAISKKVLNLSDYQLFMYGFEPTINIQKYIGLVCLSKALDIPTDDLQNAISKLPTTYIAIWKLFDEQESEKLRHLVQN